MLFTVMHLAEIPRAFPLMFLAEQNSEVFLQEHKRVLQIDVLICTSVPCGTSVENLAPD
jgi:hypothetical protein